MKLNDVLFTLFLLACIRLTVVGTTTNNKHTIVADERPEFGIQRKVKGRHRGHIVNFKNDDIFSRVSHHRSERKVKGGNSDLKQSVDSISVSTQPPPPVSATTTSDGKNGKVHKDKDKNGTKSSGGGAGNGYSLSSGSDIMDMKTVSLVLIAVTFFVIGCFVFKLIRSRSRRKTKKYGVLATHGNEVELTPLDQEDEDEDMTVFDANSRS